VRRRRALRLAGAKVAPDAIAALQPAAHAPWSIAAKQRFKQAPHGGFDLLNSAIRAMIA
jgi:hypothetical protein